MLKEFKAFMAKGNVLELAVAVIMATYFGAIVKSLVADIIMPPVGMALGNVDFADLKLVLREARAEVYEGEELLVEALPEVAINYGLFVNQILTFVIVAFSVFLIIRSYNRFKRKEEAKPTPAPAPSKEEVLLTEIRDLLAKK